MGRSGIVTLLTDFGMEDWFVGAVKGSILSVNHNARIVDISHSMSKFNIMQTAFVLFNVYKYYPEWTVHCVVVDPGVGGRRRIIAVECNNYFFVCPDNGLLSYILDEGFHFSAVEITNPKYMREEISSTFHARDIMGPVAGWLSAGVDLEELGPQITDPVQMPIPKPITKENQILGEIIYVDSFGNLITNIPNVLVPKEDMIVEAGERYIDGISTTYESVQKGELLALRGSSGYIEIAKREDRADKLFKVGTKVRIKKQGRS